MAAPWLLLRTGSHRRWLVICAVLQALSFAPLVAAALAGKMSTEFVFATIALYWAAGLASSPTWSAWMEGVVPERLRARYLARRTRWSQVGLMLGFFAGGLLLQLGTAAGYRLLCFAVLFVGAAIGRLFSAACLAKQAECPSRQPVFRPAVLADFRAVAGSGHSGQILIYMLLAQMACYISGPYFTPFMLKQLELSYLGFVTLVGLAYLAKVALLQFWGRVVDRVGVTTMLIVSGLAIVPMPALWTLSDSFGYLAVLQLYAGAGWSAFELASLLVFFDSIPAEKKVNVLTFYNFANAAAVMAGSLIGGLLMWELASSRTAYLVIFWVSAFARIGALVYWVAVTRLTMSQVVGDSRGKTPV